MSLRRRLSQAVTDLRTEETETPQTKADMLQCTER